MILILNEYLILFADYSGPGNAALLCRKPDPSSGWSEDLSEAEDLNHLGSHKLNDVLGADSRMGKTRSLLKLELVSMV